MPHHLFLNRTTSRGLWEIRHNAQLCDFERARRPTANRKMLMRFPSTVYNPAEGAFPGFTKDMVSMRPPLAFSFVLLTLHGMVTGSSAEADCTLPDSEIQRIRAFYDSASPAQHANGRTILSQLAVTNPDCIIPFIPEIYTRANLPKDCQILSDANLVATCTTGSSDSPAKR
jgi:hypothetical protein